MVDVARQREDTELDLIVMSGDLVWSGKSEEYELAEEALLEPLMGAAGLGRDRVVLVPGNHDVDRALVDVYAEKGWHDACQSRDGVCELMQREADFRRAGARLDGWNAFYDAFYNAQPHTEVAPLARMHSFESGGTRVGIGALNSAWRAGDDNDKENLVLGEPQLIPALRALDDFDLRIAVVHHPPTWLQPFDADAARAEFESRGVLVLCGHEHKVEPEGVDTPRGRVVYSRAGSLFGRFDYTNAYSLIDVDPREGVIGFRLRTWWSARREFGESEESASAGRFETAGPAKTASGLGISLRYSAVTEVLADQVELHSALADRIDSPRPFDDLVVQPRFLPTRYREATAIMAVEPDKRPQRVDPIEQLQATRVLTIAGEPESGVSTALLWILKHGFDSDTVHAPVFVRFENRFGRAQLEAAAIRTLRSYGVDGHRTHLPPLIVAVDDVRPSARDGFRRLLALIESRPEDKFVLGCSEDDAEAIASALQSLATQHGSAFLAPFGRREIRELHLRLVGSERYELLERVSRIVGAEGLPRNPFVLSALVAVLADQHDLTSLNESGVLEQYVDLLLSDALPDLERLGMDKRRRVHLLAYLASHLTQYEARVIPRLDADELLTKYFRAQGWLSASADGVINSLEKRRVLAITDDGVSFRHQALFHLFQGAAYNSDRQFATRLRSDLLANAAALRHAAGLDRQDTNLLQLVLDQAAEGLSAFDDVDLAAYEPDPETLDVLIESARNELDSQIPWPSESEMDQQIDDFDDMRAGRHASSVPIQADDGGSHQTGLDNETRRFGQLVTLLSQVLRNTELSTDLEQKQTALRLVVRGWAAVGAKLSRDLSVADVQPVISQLALPAEGAVLLERLLALVAQIVRHMLALGIGMTMASTIASRHMEAVVTEAIHDDEFTSEPIYAFFLLLLYSTLGLPDWPSQFDRLYERHQGHATLALAMRTWALVQYRATPDRREAQRLEAPLVKILAASSAPRGPAAVLQRAAAIDEVTRKLRDLRDNTQRATSSIESKIDPLDVDELQE